MNSSQKARQSRQAGEILPRPVTLGRTARHRASRPASPRKQEQKLRDSIRGDAGTQISITILLLRMLDTWLSHHRTWTARDARLMPQPAPDT